MRHADAGFSLVELMVALVVGSLVVLASAQSLVLFGQTHRRLLGDNAADQAAAIHLFNLAREVKSAGVSPVAFDGSLVCTRFNVFRDGAALLDGLQLLPVRIEDGAGGLDEIVVAGFDSILAMAGTRLVADMPTPAAVFRVASEAGFAEDDLIAVGSPGSGEPCSVFQITGIQDTANGFDFLHNSGESDWNPPNPANAWATAPAYPRGSVVFRLGALNVRRYGVADGRLERSDEIEDTSAPLASHVLGLQARYGVAAAGGQGISEWVDATGAWAALDADEAARIRAVHVAVLARNPQRLRPPEGAVDCDATVVNPSAWDDGPDFDLSADPDWRCYKYRVFDLVIPLKNRIFQGG
jgi:type IV pilus assembly protein PilW